MHNPRIAGGDPFQRVRAVARADVDPKILGLYRFGAVIRRKDMSRRPAHDAEYITVVARDPDPLPHQHLIVPAADLLKPQVPFLIDVRDLEPDLVDVPFNDNYRSAVTLQPGERVA